MLYHKLSVIILSLPLNYSNPEKVPAFITSYKDYLQDLKNANEPVFDVMAKAWYYLKVMIYNMETL